jgi:hypothetical protein
LIRWSLVRGKISILWSVHRARIAILWWVSHRDAGFHWPSILGSPFNHEIILSS